MKTVGLTGGIAMGKSTVAEMLRKRGVAVIDADLVAREVVEPGQPALAMIVRDFGRGVLSSDGSLDREALRIQILNDEASRMRLNDILHPVIIATIRERLQALEEAGVDIAVVEAALMVETGSYRNYDELWVVSCTKEVQVARLMARNDLDEEMADRWIGSQGPIRTKEELADRILWNDGDLDALELEVVGALLAASMTQ